MIPGTQVGHSLCDEERIIGSVFALHCYASCSVVVSVSYTDMIMHNLSGVYRNRGVDILYIYSSLSL